MKVRMPNTDYVQVTDASGHPIYADDGTYEYPVILENGNLGVVLRIVSTPGSWYLSTLLHSGLEDISKAERLAIDFGQDWYCYNIAEVLDHAFRTLCDQTLQLEESK